MTKIQKLGLAALVAAVTAMTMTACGGGSSNDTYEAAPNAAQTQTVIGGDESGDITATQINAGGDVQVGDSTEITITSEGDAILSMQSQAEAQGEATGNYSVGDDTGVFPGADASQAECNAAGYFWCSVKKECTTTPLNISGDGAASTCGVN